MTKTPIQKMTAAWTYFCAEHCYSYDKVKRGYDALIQRVRCGPRD